MKTESFIRILAGSFILLSVALAHLISPWWSLFTVFIGANLIQSALTGFCPPSFVLNKLGWIRSDGTITWGGTNRSA